MLQRVEKRMAFDFGIMRDCIKKALFFEKKGFLKCGSYWIRTSDPLLVRQML